MSRDTIRRGLAAIETLKAEKRRVTISAVARRTGLHRSTIHRHLALTEAIKAARPTPDTQAPAVPPDTSTTASDASLRDRIARLNSTVDHLAQTVQALTLQNEQLTAQHNNVRALPQR